MMCQLEGYSACDVPYTIENVPRHMMCQLEGYSLYMSCFLYCVKPRHMMCQLEGYSPCISCFLYSIKCAKTHDVSTRRKLYRNLSHVMCFRKYIRKFHLSYRRHVKDIQKWNVLHTTYIYFVKYRKFSFLSN